MKFLTLIFKNAFRNRRRTLLTVLSVAVSLFLLTTLVTVLTELYRTPEGADAALRIVVRHSVGLAVLLPEAHRQKIAAMPGVVDVMAMSWFGGIYVDERNFFAQFAVDADKLFDMFTENRIPPEQREAFVRERQAAVAGRELADRFGWKVGERVTLKATIYPRDVELILRGFYTGPDETQLFFHWDYLKETMSRYNSVGTFWVKARSQEDVDRLVAEIDGTFRNTNAPTKTETEKGFLLGFVSMMGNVKLLITVISSAVVFTILLVAANTMAMSIRERAPEIAVMKTLGYQSRLLLGLIVAESVFLSLAGWLLGGVGARVLFGVVKVSRYTGGMLAQFEVQPATLAGGFVLAVALGVLSCIFPAYRATRVTISEALRRVA